jgi:Tfp pilus assembly protein PilO
MQWELIVALVVAIPVILFPAVFVWFINISGILTVLKESRAREKRRAKAYKEALVRAK